MSEPPVKMNEASAQELRTAQASQSMAYLTWRRFAKHRVALVGVVVISVLVLTSFIVPLFIDEQAANRMVMAERQQAPSLSKPFGTDDIGRDIFLRSIFAGQISLRIGILAALIAGTIGCAVGAVAGYNGGWIDNVLMRLTDALLSIPNLFILIVLTRVFGSTIFVITVIIGVLSWMMVSRLVRANVLALREQDFVTAARSIGARPASILFRHVLPNTIAPLVVAATLGVGQAIILEASLSFLGLGVQPPTATWGNMLNRAQAFLVTAPWIAFFPGILILITVLSINFIGDGLRDAFDPHSIGRVR